MTYVYDDVTQVFCHKTLVVVNAPSARVTEGVSINNTLSLWWCDICVWWCDICEGYWRSIKKQDSLRPCQKVLCTEWECVLSFFFLPPPLTRDMRSPKLCMLLNTSVVDLLLSSLEYICIERICWMMMWHVCMMMWHMCMCMMVWHMCLVLLNTSVLKGFTA